MTLDSPRLTWGKHIKKLKTDCLSRLQTLKAVSGTSWGADRKTLKIFYNSFVLSKLNYGSILYESASKVLLKSLEVVHNLGLRIITGNRKTTPVDALLGETGMLPLKIKRQKLTMDYFYNIQHYAHNFSININLERHLYRDHNGYSATVCIPFIGRAVCIARKFGLDIGKTCPDQTMSPAPPWSRIYTNIHLNYNVQNITNSKISPFIAFDIRELILVRFPNYIEIYTDGSKTSDYVGAAIYIPSRSITVNWQLNAQHSIVAAELFAIKQAMQWIWEGYSSYEESSQFVILSDSLSSLMIIQKLSLTTYRQLVTTIHSLMLKLNSKGIIVALQHVPAHCGVRGNEIVDAAAKMAYRNDKSALLPIELADQKFHSKQATREQFQEYWEIQRHGIYLGTIKDSVDNWP
ncbi:unnamed protein product, partial [Rotaria magnacalcarata]